MNWVAKYKCKFLREVSPPKEQNSVEIKQYEAFF